MDKEISDVFASPKNPKSLFLPANRAPCNTKLPEDCHYQPENLVKLFLLPNIMVILGVLIVDYHLVCENGILKWLLCCRFFMLIFAFNFLDETSGLPVVSWEETKKVLR